MRKKLIFIAANILVAIMLFESAFRMLRYQAEYATFQFTEPDPVLVMRIPPNSIGHDSNGYRNHNVLAQADIVTIGDSFTWGYNTNLDQNWPSTLGRMTDRTVYNMAIGGFGPVQYLELVKQARELKPETVVVAIYMGNDIWDAYHAAYVHGGHPELRDPSVGDLSSADDLGSKIYQAGAQRAEYRQRFWLSETLSRGGWLMKQTFIGRLLFPEFSRQTVVTHGPVDRAWAHDNPTNGAVYDERPIQTVMTTEYRLLAVNLDEPCIAAGVEVTGKVLRDMQAAADSAGFDLVVVLIPTKEAAYADLMTADGIKLTTAHQQLVDNEAQIRTELIDVMDQAGMQYVDMLPILQAALTDHQPIYPHDSDGHLMALGYDLIAQAVYDLLSGQS